MRGPYTPSVKDGKVKFSVELPIELHDDLMKYLVSKSKNPNRTGFVREAVREKLFRG